ncbi:hypothetical protein PLEOSDRAFT_1106160 [Pleurotus ostreatus PC15]|uniref:Uncharacterized protein n=1 Tax=Pleurotus ostreatus (strain PC15) TaxID=1137138 RepID=A0A067NBI8_PLEO1|nr:hypothetical protein PLEOSDRAFT_1106160 [Pleurotus ostreatus PC15]
MPPGRPKIYKTLEEKTLANRSKSSRSYHKNKGLSDSVSDTNIPRPRPVGSGRPKIYQTAEEKILANRAKRISEFWQLSKTKKRQNVAGWMTLVHTTSRKFESMVHGTVPAYMEDLYRQFTISHYKTIFTDPMLEVEALRSTMRHCENSLLQLSGVDQNLRMAEAAGRAIQEVIACLEDILCSVMVGKAELFEMYKKRELMYQSL